MHHVPNSRGLGGLQKQVGGGLRLSWLVVVEKVLLTLVFQGSKETTAKWCETCSPLQAELARCACVPKVVLPVPHKRDALEAQDK